MSKELIIKGHRLSSEKMTVCVPIVSSNSDSIILEVNNAVFAGAKMIELRADMFDMLLEGDDLLSLLEKIAQICTNTIVLFTIRTSIEGGNAEIDDATLCDILKMVSSSSFVDMIDIEVTHLANANLLVKSIKNDGVFVVASHHNFGETYNRQKLLTIYNMLYESGADVLKVAMMPQSKEDVLRLMTVTEEAGRLYPDRLFIAISMGQLGQVSRFAGISCGSAVSFAALEQNSAPGQLGFAEMQHILEIIQK